MRHAACPKDGDELFFICAPLQLSSLEQRLQQSTPNELVTLSVPQSPAPSGTVTVPAHQAHGSHAKHRNDTGVHLAKMSAGLSSLPGETLWVGKVLVISLLNPDLQTGK